MKHKIAELFTPIEAEALNLLLSGDLPILQHLRQQLEQVEAVERTFTLLGFYLRFKLRADTAVLAGAPSFAISDVGGQMEGTELGVGFVLFVSSGRIDQLEGATFGGEKWPEATGKFKLRYDTGERSLTAVEQMISRRIQLRSP